MILDKTTEKLPIVLSTEDGTVLKIQHISTNHFSCLSTFVRSLSFSTRYFRFGNGDFNPSEEEVLRECNPNPQECVHLLVMVDQSDQEQVIGSARYVIQSEVSCEFAIAVADSWKHHGVGHLLMQALMESAKSRGIKEIYGRILGSNLGMIEFVRGCGFEIMNSAEGSWLKIATLSL